jgi:hypothetical protein
MDKIYRAAKRVLVWVGTAKSDTALAFQEVKRLFQSISTSSKEVDERSISSSFKKIEEIWDAGKDSWVGCLNELIQRPVSRLNIARPA